MRKRSPFGIFCLALLFGLGVHAGQAQVRINEVMPSNTTVLADPSGAFPDWIELFNAGTAPISLLGYGFSDTAHDLFEWVFPELTLAPNEHRIVFASGTHVPPVQQWSTLIAQGHEWHYWERSQQPLSSWTNVGFPVSAWATGPTGLGYGDGDDATIINPAPALALYARTSFTIDDPSDVEQLVLHIDYDDAFVAYINGTEIARANIGTPGGERPSIVTPANSAGEPFGVRGLPLPAFTIHDPASLLQVGENVLAVQVHNASTSSSDLTFIPFLTVGFQTTRTDRPSVADALAERSEFASALHVPFRLSASGETVYLTHPDGTLADSLAFGPIPTDVSVGRYPDGSATLGFLSAPTPGASNASLANAPAAAPLFSMPGGQYPSALTIDVTTATPGATIRYTTDGSIPTATDTAIRNDRLVVLTSRVVRARAFAPGSLPSPVVTHTYVLNQPTDLPIVAIATAPEHLWDQDTGIYTMGRNASSNFPHFGANFWEDWEIPVHVEWVEPNNATRYEAHAGLKIFGGWSRGFPQKSFSLFARPAYGNPEFAYPFFANRSHDSYQALVLRNSGNDWSSTMMRDGVLQTLVRDLDIDHLAHRPTVVYLNGAYWGIHNLREKINEHYVAQTGQIEADAIELLEYVADSGPVALHGTTEAYDALIRYLQQTDLTTEAAYKEVQRRLDVDSFIDYQLAQIYFDNRDWPGNNSKLWRPRTPEGRFRFILYDTDFGFGIWNTSAYRENTLVFATDARGPDWPNPPWSTLILRRLLTNPMFEQAFINRFADLLNGPFATQAVYAVIDSMETNISTEMAAHGNRWGRDLQAWRGAINGMRSFALNRPSAMRGHMASYFGLRGTERITVNVSDTAHGNVLVNRLLPDQYPWSGSYYSGVSVPITALPKPGYRFAGWSGTVTSSEPTVWVDPANIPSLTATFERGLSPEAHVRINEIQYHASDALDSDDWVELLNTHAEPVDVSGWSLSDGNPSNRYTIPPQTVLSPNGFLVMARFPDQFATMYPNVPHIGGWTFGLSNGGETVLLTDSRGALVDSLTYDDATPWPTEADGKGPTLERRDPSLASSDPLTWHASLVDGGTPHAPNSTSTVATEDPPLMPQGPFLSQPYPNPFGSSTTLTFHLQEAGIVSLDVFDVLGRHVAALAQGYHSAPGSTTIRWEADSLPAGVYFVRLTLNDKPLTTTPVLKQR